MPSGCFGPCRKRAVNVSARTAVFRADASLQIGSGHVMRCLTLADALSARGVRSHFICQDLGGDLVDLVGARGYGVSVIRSRSDLGPAVSASQNKDSSADWSSIDQVEDARATAAVLGDDICDWLVVDHYSLAAEWEQMMRPHCRRLLVIDDLAHRHHNCDVLVNQNLGRTTADYVNLVPSGCLLLIGAQYALLRPEFSKLREYSLRRRSPPRLKHLLVSMGGVDQDNATGAVLEALKRTDLPSDCTITVVLGLRAPWLEKVKAQASTMPWNCVVRVNIDGMAKIIADSDLVIGAVGGTAWERCCLGAPSLLVVLAENQRSGATALDASGSGRLLGEIEDISSNLPQAVMSLMEGHQLQSMSEAAADVCDGLGSFRVLKHMCSVEPGGSESDEGCRVRPMREGDLRNVLDWRNSVEVRRYMYSQHVITESEHLDWFARASVDPMRELLIAEDAGAALGFVQFTRQEGGNAALWGFYTVPGSPKGTRRKMGRAALDYAFGTLKVRKVVGEALAINEASIRFHRSLGFTEKEVREIQTRDGRCCHTVHTFELPAEEWTKHDKD